MVFTPFVEGKQKVRHQITTNGIDTRPIDSFRQGVEINDSITAISTSIMPHIGSGNSDHSFQITNYGISIGFDDTDPTRPYVDSSKFSAVDYLENQNTYRYPIVFNGRISGFSNSSLEPLTIPSLHPETDTEIPFYAHRIRGELSGGQNKLILPLIHHGSFGISNAFHAGGSFTLGNIRTPGISSGISYCFLPFDDSSNNFVTSAVKLGSEQIWINVIRQLNHNWDNDLRPFKSKTATCGYQFGLSENRNGTDSIAYGGRLR